ncbi:MAG: hypothetical protein Q9190_004463 [Brigantiaea leucoxantha]
MVPSLSNDPETFPVRFYSKTNSAPDRRGRNLSTILSWSDDELEFCHDYIQNLFPLPERSPINPSAPVIDRRTFEAFRSNHELRGRLRESLDRILRFYGFEMQATISGQVLVTKGPNFLKAAGKWVTRFDHNHLRITRIIRSCRVLGLEEEAITFFQALTDVYEDKGSVSPRSVQFWARAAKRPLFLAPEDDEDLGQGARFLYEFEKERVNDVESNEGQGRQNGPRE